MQTSIATDAHQDHQIGAFLGGYHLNGNQQPLKNSVNRTRNLSPPLPYGYISKYMGIGVSAAKTAASRTQVARTGSAYFLGFVTACLATPYIARRVGHIRSFAVLAAFYAAVVLVFPHLS